MDIRVATENDIPDLAHIQVEGWRAAYAGLADQSYLDSLNEDDRAKDWRHWMQDEAMTALIARDGDIATGFVSFGPLRTPPPGSSPIRPQYSSEIYALYVLPEHWRKGIGRALLRDAALRLKERRHSAVCLWVMDKNQRANTFYKALGGQRIGKKQVEIGGRMLTDAAFGWRDTTVLFSLPTA